MTANSGGEFRMGMWGWEMGRKCVVREYVDENGGVVQLYGHGGV
jgi:hypothetical protein